MVVHTNLKAIKAPVAEIEGKRLGVILILKISVGYFDNICGTSSKVLN
jgi:hypothetical protein